MELTQIHGKPILAFSSFQFELSVTLSLFLFVLKNQKDETKCDER